MAEVTTFNKTPKVGDGATIQYWSDRAAATVIWVSPSGHQVEIQEDDAKLTSGTILSEYQEYTYAPDPKGRKFTVTRRQNGDYRIKGQSTRVYFGFRKAYRDPHF